MISAAREPVPLLADPPRTYWWFEGHVYWEDDGLAARDVLALVRDRERRRARQLERAHAALAHEDGPGLRRGTIPVAVRRGVFDRDGGRCRVCGDAFDLQYDHVIPLALGGSNQAENLQLLCGTCNREKGAAVG